jgi:hypothetical protein
MQQPLRESFGISHSLEEESLDAKARWFASLSPEERMMMLAEWTELVLQNNPRLIGVKDAIPVKGRVRVLELPPG